MDNTKKIAVIYMRYSSHNQTENSIEGQKAVIYSYASKHGYEIIDEYIDRAKTGTNIKRIALNRLLTECERNNSFSYVLIYKLDRLARGFDIHTALEKHLKDNGKKLISVTEYVNDDDVGSQVAKQVTKVINEAESLKISENTLRGLKVNASKAESTGGMCPLGYDISEKKLIINGFEAQAVKLIFDLYSQGFSKNFICKELNSRGYKTKPGNRFNVNSLSSILTNQKYIGTYFYNKRAAKKSDKKRNNHKFKAASEIVTVKGGCPSIISNEVFEKVQAILKQKSEQPKNTHKQTYLLSGLVKCNECGCNMMVNKYTGGRNHREYISFYCNNHKNYKTCSTKDVDKTALEEFIAHILSVYLFTDDSITSISKMMSKISKSLNNEDKRKLMAIGQELGGIENGIKNYIKRLCKTTSDATISYIEDEIDQLEDQKNTLLGLKSSINAKINPALTKKQLSSLQEEFADYLLSHDNIVESRILINTLVDDIRVSNHEIEVMFNTP